MPPLSRTSLLPPGAANLPRVLVMTHSHPKLTRGGSEIAAFALTRALRQAGAPAWFLGCGNDAGLGLAREGAPFTQPFGPDDYLYSAAAAFDHFKFANPDPQFPGALAALIAELQPDIVHAHHYTRFGVEMFQIIKRARPATRIVLTLHEYLAICHHHGQMVKRDSTALCSEESARECARCFPEISPQAFFLRRRYIQYFLEDVDLFLAPSAFLAGRYVGWGIPPQKIRVIENMPPARIEAEPPPPPDEPAPRRSLSTLPVETGNTPLGGSPTVAMRGRPVPAQSAGLRAPRDFKPAPAVARVPRSRPLRFGFFGQLSPLKGLGVLLEAARRLQRTELENYAIVIHGDARHQPLEYQQFVQSALADAPDCVAYMGPYQHQDVGRLMQRVDAVIVPSIWWENSPLVIQEALSAGRPVICSNIGGMAEKVRHGRDGMHFEAGQPDSLARVLANLITYPETLADMSADLARPLDEAAALQLYLEVYRSLLAG